MWSLFKESAVLPIDNADTEIYRISFVPTFANPIAIRVQKQQSEIVLIAKRLSGMNGQDLGVLKTEKKKTLREKEWNRLLDLLKEAQFWDLPFLEKQPEPNERGEETICVDGSDWTIEGVKQGHYHVVSRYCPDSEQFEAIGLYLAKLSDLSVKERELY